MPGLGCQQRQHTHLRRGQHQIAPPRLGIDALRHQVELRPRHHAAALPQMPREVAVRLRSVCRARGVGGNLEHHRLAGGILQQARDVVRTRQILAVDRQ